MTKTRKFNKTYSAELLRIAEQDLETAGILIPTNLKRRENILFHIEQAIEKSLKAVLCRHEVPVPMVHELAILIDHLPKGMEPPASEEISDLTQFATIRRYEEGKATLTDEEVQAAYKLGESILAWAKKA